MKVALAARYRNWMVLLFPTTLGLGTAALWIRSLTWPLIVDESSLTLRSHRRLNWHSIEKIGLSRSYLDGHVSQIRIHHQHGVSFVPVDSLHDGELVVRTILRTFERVNRVQALKALKRRAPKKIVRDITADSNRRSTLAPPLGASAHDHGDESSQTNIGRLVGEFGMLIREALAKRLAESSQTIGSPVVDNEAPLAVETLDDQFAMLRAALAQRSARYQRPMQLEQEWS